MDPSIENAQPGPSLDALIGAFYDAIDRGEAVDRREWLNRHPRYADEMARFLQDHDLLNEVVAPLQQAVTGEWTPGRELAQADDARGASTVDEPRGPPDSTTAALRSNVIGDYQLIRLLGRGAMGEVYEARQISLQRTVALKMIRTGLLATPADIQRFHNDAEALALLDHPRIVTIHSVGEDQGFHHFSMKLIRGGDLSKRLGSFRNDPRAAASLMIEVARAIQYAHQKGILHRDLKPGNILIDENGQPHVSDFGLAKRLGSGSDLTGTGAILGTPSYMAPEQAEGGKGKGKGGVTTITDVYGLGAVLYALLTGRAPFVGDTIIETIEQVRTQEPVPPTRLQPRVPRDLETICLKCLEKDPNQRYASAEDLADDLRRWLDGEPIQARRVSPIARAWMWCRRNRLVAAFLVVVSLFAGVSTWQWLHAEGNR